MELRIKKRSYEKTKIQYDTLKLLPDHTKKHVMCQYISSATRSPSGLLCKNAGTPDKPKNLRCFSFPFHRHHPFKRHRTASRHAFHSGSLKRTYILSSVGLTVAMHIICGCCLLQFASFQKSGGGGISSGWERRMSSMKSIIAVSHCV